MRFAPNAMNRAVHVPMGGVGDAAVPLSAILDVTVDRAFVTNIVNLRHATGRFRFRCYGAAAFAERIRAAVAAHRAATAG